MRRPERWRRLRQGLRTAGGERGVALAMALIVLVVLSSLAAAVLAIGMNETAISSNLVRTAQALYLAEAGVEAAFAWMSIDATSRLSGAPAEPTTMPVATPTGTLATIGSYAVEYRSVSANTVEVVATGTASSSAFGRATRTVRAHMTNAYSAVDAVRSELNGTLGGDARISGNCGSVHSNRDVAFNGTSFSISKNVSAVGTVPDTGGTVGGARFDGVPKRPLPTIDPPGFLTNLRNSWQSTIPASTDVALYELTADGKIFKTVWNAAGTPETTPVTVDKLDGWEYSGSAEWRTYNTEADRGQAVYYVDGQVHIGNSGKGSWDLPTPWHASIIATAGIQITGDPRIQSVIPDLILMSGGAIRITSDPKLRNGVIVAQGDVTVTGKPEITGSIVTRGTADIRGAAVVTYECGGNPPLTAALQIITWGY